MPKKITLTILFILSFLNIANFNNVYGQNYKINNISNNNSSENYPELSKFPTKPYKLGTYNLTAFGLKIYKIELHCEKPIFSYEVKSAIIINYQRKLIKEHLIERAINEIARINNIKDNALLNDYKIKLHEIFFNVDKGDRKTALFDPQEGVKLFLNGVAVGQIKDLVFAKRFMDIWLNQKSAYPKMTKAMLGEND